MIIFPGLNTFRTTGTKIWRTTDRPERDHQKIKAGVNVLKMQN